MLSDNVIAIYCFTDDLLNGIHHQPKEGCRTTDAAIIPTALVSALVLKGHQRLAIQYMRSHSMPPLLPGKAVFPNGCTVAQSCCGCF